MSIDETGWLRSGVELRFARGSDGTIQPEGVRVGPDAVVGDVLALGDVFDRSTQYNQLLHSLRNLHGRLEVAIQRSAPDLDTAYSSWRQYQELLRLDEMIALRQAQRMGYRTVRIDTLDREIEFMREHHACLVAAVAHLRLARNELGERSSRKAGALTRLSRRWRAR